MKIGKIYLKQKNKRLDQPYDYLVPDNVTAGQRVIAPFGRGNRALEGFVVGVKEDSGFRSELKEITEVLDDEPVLNPRQIELLLYLNNRNFKGFYSNLSYFTSLNKVKKKKEEPFSNTIFKLKEKKKVRGNIQKAVIEALEDRNLSFKELTDLVPKVTRSTIERLIELEIIEAQTTKVEPLKVIEPVIFEPSGESQKYYKRYIDQKSLDEAIDSFISPVGQTLILFTDNFSVKNFKSLNKTKDDVLYYNPYEKSSTKHQIYKKIKNGSIRVVIGSDAALFLPYNDLRSVIIVDAGDERYAATKEIPYDTLENAEKLAEIWGADLYALDIIDSMISTKKTLDESWQLLDKEGLSPFDIEIINTNEIVFDEIEEEEKIISDTLKEAIQKSLDEKKKTILFINRKGYYNNHFCANCGEPFRCPRCGSVLQSRKNGKEVLCRLCGFENIFPTQCPSCGHDHFALRQFGIDKTLEEVQELFPQAKIEAYFYGHTPSLDNADIIVATRSIIYSKPIENVGTVAGTYVDIDINYPDYHSSESALRLYYTLFSQFPEAKKILQTKTNGENSIFKAITGDSLDFLYELSESRSALKLPPFYDLFTFTLTADKAKIVNADTKLLFDRIKARNKENNLQILAPYMIREKKGTSQRRFVVKADKNKGFIDFIKQMYRDGEIEALKSHVSIVVNPAQII